jgi:hypothetical protein
MIYDKLEAPLQDFDLEEHFTNEFQKNGHYFLPLFGWFKTDRAVNKYFYRKWLVAPAQN